MDVDVSVVMPCLNEKRTIEKCVDKVFNVFNKMRISGEIIVVDNGSVDGSAVLAKSLGAKAVIESRRGYGNALKRGIKEARGKYIIIGDADNTYDFLEIEKFIRLLQEGADLVVGSRLKGKIYPKAMPWFHRWVGTLFLTWLINVFFKANVSDINCGLRGFKKNSIEKLCLGCDGMEFASEMIIKAAQKKLNIKEVAISYYPNHSRDSHLRPFRDGWRHLKAILRFKREKKGR